MSLLFGIGLFSACAGNDAAQSSGETEPATPKGVLFTTHAPKAKAKMSTTVAGDDTPTRTLIQYQIGQGAEAYWETADYIFVKNKAGVWKKSIYTAVNGDGSSATFTLPGNVSDYGAGCEVRYTGFTGSPDQVKTGNPPVQKRPGVLDDAGNFGDCGVGFAVAGSDPSMFNFQLEHKAGYLCFLPRQEDAALGANTYITKIVVSSANPICGIYDFSTGSFGTTPPSGYYRFMLQFQSPGTYANGFPLTNTTSSVLTNGAYIGLAPGTYHFNVQYYLYDPTTSVEGFLTKYVTVSVDAGEIKPVTANLQVPTVPLNTYYNWDAEKYGFYGNESQQPTTNGGEGDLKVNFPYGMPPTDPRGPQAPTNKAAEHSCKDCPNYNELTWYIERGHPMWDADGIFAFNNHLQKGGVWLLKKDNIPGFSAAAAPNGVNFSDAASHYTTAYYHPYGTPTPPAYPVPTVTLSGGAPQIADRGKYFFLPAAGYYIYDRNPSGSFINRTVLHGLGTEGVWWSCDGANAAPNRVGKLYFSASKITIHIDGSLYLATYRTLAPIWKVQ